MSGLLLVCFLLLSRQAAQVSGTMKEQENRKEIIAVPDTGERIREWWGLTDWRKRKSI